MGELDKVAREEQHRLELEARMEQSRERLREGYSYKMRAFAHEQNIEGIVGGTWTESDIQRGITSTTTKLQEAQNDYKKTLEEASKSNAPEEFQSRIKELETTIAELKDALSSWQKKLVEQTKDMITNTNFNP